MAEAVPEPAIRRPDWWIGLLFAIGSTCFLVGPFPGFVALVGSAADGVVFFVGSLFFTSAAALQTWQDRGAASWIQLAGTLFFNASTFHALQKGLSTSETDRLVWTPDAFGSVCFLLSSWLAWRPVRRAPHGRPEWRIAALNLLGSVAFGISAVASYVVPDTGDVLALAAANVTTALGALCFLLGALLLLSAPAEPAPTAS